MMKIKFFLFIMLFVCIYFLIGNNLCYSRSSLDSQSFDLFKFQNSYAKTSSVTLQINTDNNWQLYVLLPDNTFRKYDNSSKQIKLSPVILRDCLNSKEFVLEPGKPVQINSSNSKGSFIEEFSLRLDNNECYIPGVYLSNLEFMLVTPSGTVNSINTIAFKVPEILRIKIPDNQIIIDVPTGNVLKEGYINQSIYNSKVYIQSNTPWKLIVDAQNCKQTDNFALKVISASDAVTNLTNSTYINPDKKTVIAEGPPTFTTDGHELDSKEVTINYAFITDANKIQHSGNYFDVVNFYLDKNWTP